MRVVSAVSFLTPAEVAQLAASTGLSQSSTLVKRQAQQLGFLQALGSRIGFPQRTVATAQLLLLRFHLFYPSKEFVAHEVAIACMAVASKICDTPKKAREIVLSSWALRYPELVRTTAMATAQHGATRNMAEARSHATSSQQHLGLGVISESDVDPAVLEKERKRVVSIESLVLQSIAFNFNLHVQQNFRLAVKVARKWGADKTLAKLAWQTTADCHRTYGPLCYPPATIALAGLYCAALLQNKAGVSSESTKAIMARLQCKEGDVLDARTEVESTFLTTIDGVEEVVHLLLDLYLLAISAFTSAAMSTAATPISPATPASPAEPVSYEYPASADGRQPSSASSTSTSRKISPHVYAPPPYGLLFCLSPSSPQTHAAPSTGIGSGTTTDIATDLTQIKIDLRQEEDKRRARASMQSGMLPPVSVADAATLVRAFDKGGLVGDVELVIPDDDEEEEVDTNAKDLHNVPLQRFLF